LVPYGRSEGASPLGPLSLDPDPTRRRGLTLLRTESRREREDDGAKLDRPDRRCRHSCPSQRGERVEVVRPSKSALREARLGGSLVLAFNLLFLGRGAHGPLVRGESSPSALVRSLIAQGGRGATRWEPPHKILVAPQPMPARRPPLKVANKEGASPRDRFYGKKCRRVPSPPFDPRSIPVPISPVVSRATPDAPHPWGGGATEASLEATRGKTEESKGRWEGK
jgi:hypothetical protein